MLEQIRVVLSHTSHPGNIGASARAMKVMGLTELYLVKPKHFPSTEATERSAGASDILENARLFDQLDQALADSQLVIGASARSRSMPGKLITPRDLAEMMAQDPSRKPVSIVFGRESSGLSNQELNLCHYHLWIPTNPDYSSLNLAAAVQIIAYEMRLRFADHFINEQPMSVKRDRPVTRQQLNGLLEHFEQTMRQSGYLQDDQEKLLDQRLNRLFNKAELRVSELNILRGFLSSVNRHFSSNQR